MKPLLALLLLAAPLVAEPLRVLCIGDSITQGGKRDRDEFTYRHPLFAMLTEAGVEFDFIGTRDKGLQPDAKWPDVAGVPFDPDHEGYYGAKTAAVLDKLRRNLPELPPPDIALIHLGTNDQNAANHDQAIVEPLTAMIGLLRERNPEVVVLVGHLNFKGGAAAKIRPKVEAMAERLDTEASPVRTVHHYRDFNADPKHPETDTFDWAHPNPQGQRKMAAAWFEAMKPHLPEGDSE